MLNLLQQSVQKLKLIINKTQIMSFFGVELNAQVNRLFHELKLTLSKNRYLPNFRTIYRAFVKHDPEQSGLISVTNFEKALNDNGIFYKKFEIQAYQKAFGVEGGKINWFAFMSFLREPINQFRSHLVQKIFDWLDQNHRGQIHYSQLEKKFNPKEILQFKLKQKSKQTIQKQLLALIPLNANGCVTKEQFINFYQDLCINIPSDKIFAEYTSSHWEFPYSHQKSTPQQQIKTAIRFIRYKLIQMTQGTNEQFLLKQIFNEFDKNKNGNLCEEELYAMLVKLQIPTQQRMIKPLLQKLDHNKNGAVQFQEFKNFLFFDPYPI